MSNKRTSVCLCIDPPKESLFDKGGYYEWQYGIDGIIVFDEKGNRWVSSEIGFHQYFQMLTGKYKRKEI